MSSIRLAHFASILYFIIIICGISSEMLVRSPFINMQDMTITLANLLQYRSFFNFAFGFDLLMLICDITLAIVFYILFQTINKNLSLSAFVFRLLHSVVVLIALLFFYFAIFIATQNSLVSVQNKVFIKLFLELHAYGYDLGLIFFAFSNLALGILFISSTSLPKLLGYGLLMASIVYLIGSLIHFFASQYLFIIKVAYIIPFIVESSFAFWLLMLKQKHEKLFIR
ncbi:DUF4386 domain-containing protein [Sulfurimonas sp.]|uniref:DUF4386 domain-containing protein n=1 Tax=Sulfurimonas sp. TaxID=2022749 RepID=UPI003D09B680